MSVLSGFNSGVLSLLVGHPFDTLKVRMQVNSEKRFSGSMKNLYRGKDPTDNIFFNKKFMTGV